jgi:type IV pilus assembly protein PilM
MAFQTIWSIDLGRSSLKAVKLTRDRNNVEILAVDKVDYPPGKNGVDAAAQAKEALGIFRARNNVSEPVAVTHPGQGTFYRPIKVPASDDKKIESMVGYEAAQQIPFPLDEVIWDYHITKKDYLPGEERDVALFAVRRDAIDDFLLDFQNEHMDVEVVTIGYIGLLNFVQHDLRPEEPSIILDIGASHTDLVLVDDSRFWVRALPHSGSDITNAIAQRFKLGFAEAEKLKIESSKVPQQAAKIFQAVIQPKLRELVGEIHRSIGYYRSQAGEVSFKHLYLLGNGAKVVGIKKFLEEQLGVQVHRVQSIHNFRVNRDVNLKLLQANLPAFGSALGCGLQALDAATCNVDLVPKEEKLKKSIQRKKKHAFVAAGVLLVCMVLAALVMIRKTSSVEDTRTRADRLATTIKKADDAIKKVERGGLTSTLEKQDFLRGISRSRSLPFLGLTALEDVLATFPNGTQPDVSVPEGDQAALEAARKTYNDEYLLSCLWLASVTITETKFPEPEGSVGAKPKAAAPNAVPAYRFEAYVVVKARSDALESFQFVRTRFADALEDKNRHFEFLDPKVSVESGVEIPAIFYVGQGKELKDDFAQEGGPFYGCKVRWLVYTEKPEEPKVPLADDEAESDSKKAKSPRAKSSARS